MITGALKHAISTAGICHRERRGGVSEPASAMVDGHEEYRPGNPEASSHCSLRLDSVNLNLWRKPEVCDAIRDFIM